jgi:O-acetyl-ADP-ribose deacetylase (regulator of RNase III)
MDFLKKDITTVEAPAVIIHGVNCQRAMGSGIAKVLFTKWPEIRESYMTFSKEEMILGKIDPVPVDENLYVINCWTQKYYGYDKRVYADTQAVKVCLQEVAQFCTEVNIFELYSPKIGCGLGGLDWEKEVQPIFQEIEESYPSLNITICSLD